VALRRGPQHARRVPHPCAFFAQGWDSTKVHHPEILSLLSESAENRALDNCTGKKQASSRDARDSMYYSATWTECGCLISCSHEHKTVAECASCIPCAGGYVVGVENGAMRSLTAEEESEFQCAVPSHSTHNSVVETTLQRLPSQRVVTLPRQHAEDTHSRLLPR